MKVNLLKCLWIYSHITYMRYITISNVLFDGRTWSCSLKIETDFIFKIYVLSSIHAVFACSSKASRTQFLIKFEIMQWCRFGHAWLFSIMIWVYPRSFYFSFPPPISQSAGLAYRQTDRSNFLHTIMRWGRIPGWMPIEEMDACFLLSMPTKLLMMMMHEEEEKAIFTLSRKGSW